MNVGFQNPIIRIDTIHRFTIIDSHLNHLTNVIFENTANGAGLHPNTVYTKT